MSARHTDAATERLIELMMLDGLTPEEAVAQTALIVALRRSLGLLGGSDVAAGNDGVKRIL